MGQYSQELAGLLKRNEERILSGWIKEQTSRGPAKISVNELKTQCSDFLRLFVEALQNGEKDSLRGSAWENVKKILGEISRSRGLQGFSPTDTAMFVFSLKAPIFEALRQDLSKDLQMLADVSWEATVALDQLGLYTTEVFQKTRDEVILRQQEELLELSTPVVKLWDGILALPMIGTLDSSRTQIVMESLLQKIVETDSEIAIIDITGVPTVDTLVAQHLIKTVTAARLMGAECIISGIRPQIAATIVHLGVDLSGVITKANLADAFVLALAKSGKNLDRFSTSGLRGKRG